MRAVVHLHLRHHLVGLSSDTISFSSVRRRLDRRSIIVACFPSSNSYSVRSGPSGMKMGAVFEDENDWLVSYLATTQCGKDPKINAATQKLRQTALPAKNSQPRTSPSSGSHVPSINIASTNIASSSNSTEPQKRSDRRRSWATSRFNLRKSMTGNPPPNVKIPTGFPSSSRPSPSAKSHSSTSSSSSPKEQPSPREPQTPRQITSMKPTQESKPVLKGEGIRNLRKDDEEENDWLPSQCRAAQRLSMTGRRPSMDYSDLDAVRARLTQATSLWAVKDEDEEDDSDSTSVQPNEAKSELPSPSAGSRDLSVAKERGIVVANSRVTGQKKNFFSRIMGRAGASASGVARAG